MSSPYENNGAVSGSFLSLDDERFYVIRNVDKMAPFFTTVVSSSDHWLFVSSTGGLTAGRVSPETALFPYITVDYIHDCTGHTGSTTLFRVHGEGRSRNWEPFNREHDGRYRTSRHLYKNLLGNKLGFEEINHDLRLAFRYRWATSDRYGFVRRCQLANLGDQVTTVEMIDGLQNILPAGTPRHSQTNSSNLVDAYKWSELDEERGLALFTLYSGITDRAEPRESLRATTLFCLGLERRNVLLSSDQIAPFRRGEPVRQECHKRGIRGAYLVNSTLELQPAETRSWELVADIERSQPQVVALRGQLAEPETVRREIAASVEAGSDRLARIVAAADGFQATGEENVAAHHYANVLFNTLRGGGFDDQYRIRSRDFANTVRGFNRKVYNRNLALFDALPTKIDARELLREVRQREDRQLLRLAYEYLPITFGRRHGDPSRPWNQFAIRLTDENGDPLLYYQGNWRDIFQNWEALTFSAPEFIEGVIARFVNASTMDGYNPYRITKEGIDWEVEDPDDPWSYIGYWGDHQIIYLLKLLELSLSFHPARLGELLHQPLFCYANVPYRIKPFDALLENPKSTVVYDEELAARIEQRVMKIGADGKLVLDAEGEVYQVNLLEKLLVPLLAKLGNLVLDGGIWLNTQRPEWNDANNALVGHGLSMVTLYYMRRYIHFLQRLLQGASASTTLSTEVSRWLQETAAALSRVRPHLGTAPVSPRVRHSALVELGQAASRYRQAVYRQTPTGTVEQPMTSLLALLEDALAAVDHSIATNRRAEGLYHAYNLLNVQPEAVTVDPLYPMLEGQVAVLSAGALPPAEVVEIVEALFASDLYRPDQQSFMLYPDRQLPGFLQKNQIPQARIDEIPLLQQMVARGDPRIVERDAEGCYRFNADFANVGELNAQLDRLSAELGETVEAARPALAALYEQVFRHREFTGRSGGMFGFEGLGSIYWHMVAKLLLAVQENFFAALAAKTERKTVRHLGRLYYRVRDGIGFNKSPNEYGAFPTDPYSHTPRHAGARQPGMTGQVKEEVLSRFGELGVRVSDGTVRFQPALLRAREFGSQPRPFRYLDVEGQWQHVQLPAAALAFTWCQVPVLYHLDDHAEPSLTLFRDDGSHESRAQHALSAEESEALFARCGRIRKLVLVLGTDQLFAD